MNFRQDFFFCTGSFLASVCCLMLTNHGKALPAGKWSMWKARETQWLKLTVEICQLSFLKSAS